MTIQHRLIEYKDGDTLLEAYLAYDDSISEPRPGIIIAHTWWGRGALECKRADQLAELGYVGFALDMYGKGKLGTTPEENGKMMQPLMDDRAVLQNRMAVALTIAQAQTEVDASNMAVMGYCLGGLCALDLARTGADVKGAISFHGLFDAPDNIIDPQIKARVLCLDGHDDPMTPNDKVVTLQKELTDAGVDWQLHTYGGTMHGFTNPDADMPKMGIKYNAVADRRSWQALENFLAEIF
ncbi:MAG: dienelactone hydrolase family protein [Porticoccaceae bacterium]|nr:dienelactone hydrolase family protein [Porticoccaceae bacterium]